MSIREERVERWVDRLNPKVEYCESCQPFDHEDQKIFWAQGDRIGVGDFLTNAGVPDDLQEEVASRLRCRECSSDGFSTWDDIGIETREEREHRERWKEWERKYSPQVDAFGKHLALYPYLGLSHPLGRKIHKAIRTFPLRELSTTKWWRARKPDGGVVFGPSDMAPPPPDKATVEGRFNHYGQVVFYLASTALGSLAETLEVSRGEGIGWVQRFSVPAKTQVLDLVAPDFYDEYAVPILALGLMSRLPQLRPDPQSPWKPEYFIPRFIADCAREQGIAGVVFESQKHMDRNLALFQWIPSKVRAVGKPRLEQYPRRSKRRAAYETVDF